MGRIQIEEIPVEQIEEFWKIHIRYLIDDGVITDEEDIEYFQSAEYRDVIKAHMIRQVDQHHMLYFVRNGVRIGASQYNTYQSEDGKCFILDFWVFPAFRGNGTGHQCFEALQQYTKADGAHYYELNCTKENAHRFWKSLGFVDCGVDEDDMPVMQLYPLRLQPMTREMCHEFYKDFQNDPAIGHYYEYVYTPEITDRYFDTNSVADRKLFALMVGNQIVGECKLKNIDPQKRECRMGIHLQNDAVKEKGYGTQAERLILQYAFGELGMVAVNADAALKNTRSQHVLEKVGFRYTHEDDTFKYYRCENNRLLREKRIQERMGKEVHVVVDRPVGYQHGDIVYPINYGYIPGIIAGDGEEQDAYILGIKKPLAEFDGQIIAVICRKNDCEDKLVVAPVGSVYHQGQIAEAVHFQEQYFDTRIISCFEKSCGVLPYRMVNDQQEFLLVFETYSKCWSLPKGHIEAGETDVQAALRELYEETGMTATLDTSKCASIEYPISNFARKQVAFFLGEVTGVPKVREGEIDKFKWVTAEELKDYLFPDMYDACKTLLR